MGVVVILGVFGPREDADKRVYDDYAYVDTCLYEFGDVTHVISGGGAGIEQLSLKWAELHKLTSRAIPPNIARNGRENAFKYRNIEIIEKADTLAVFWNGNGSYYQDLISTILKYKKPVTIYPLS